MCAMPLSSPGTSPSRGFAVQARIAQCIRYKPLGDIALFFGLLVLLELALPGEARLASIEPHPFWLPVLLVSVQHGSRAGLVAAIVAMALTVLWVYPDRAPTEDFYSYTTSLFIEPVLWIAAALILGQIRDRHLAEKQELEDQAKALLTDRRLIGEHSLGLSRRVGDLERLIATIETASAGEALRLLAELRDAPSKLIHPRLETAAASLLGPCVLSVHRQQGADVVTTIISSSKLNAAIPRRGPRYARALTNAVKKKPRALTFLVPKDRDLLDRALFAVTIPSENSAVPLGMLVCEMLDPTRLDLVEDAPSVVVAMEALAASLSYALKRTADVPNEQPERGVDAA